MRSSIMKKLRVNSGGATVELGGEARLGSDATPPIRRVMCCKSRGGLSRLGLLWGISASAALLVAFVSGSWLSTKEPVTLPNSQISTSITFRIGLWRVCPTVKRVNGSINAASPVCQLVKYSGWESVGDLGIWTTLDFAPVFVSRMSEVEENEVIEIINELKSNGPPGEDIINSDTMKECCQQLVKPMRYITNRVMQLGTFTKYLKSQF
ncbi:hypothetical protein JTB14_021319 [Gonioctena quinquepunctata]|nr:hypothetical protein JTB14_021319 [Gonioctena quinquepunctata]